MTWRGRSFRSEKTLDKGGFESVGAVCSPQDDRALLQRCFSVVTWRAFLPWPTLWICCLKLMCAVYVVGDSLKFTFKKTYTIQHLCRLTKLARLWAQPPSHGLI